MTAFIDMGMLPLQVACIAVPTARGRQHNNEVGMLSLGALPDDPVGAMTITLTNMVVGSRYRIERQSDGSLAEPSASAEGVASSSTVSISLSYYATGNSNNDLRIKARKGTSAPKHLPFETLATIGPGDQSVYIAQVLDPIA